jgi:hypothetical protein
LFPANACKVSIKSVCAVCCVFMCVRVCMCVCAFSQALGEAVVSSYIHR